MANPGGFTNQVADLLLGGPKVEPQEETVYITDSTVLKRFAGRYYSERGDRLEVLYHDGRVNRHNPNGQSRRLYEPGGRPATGRAQGGAPGRNRIHYRQHRVETICRQVLQRAGR